MASDMHVTAKKKIGRHRWHLVRRLRQGAEVISGFVVLLVLWQVIISVFHPAAYLLPAPLSVWRDMWSPEYNWLPNIGITTEEIIGGFLASAIAGIALAILIAWTPLLERTVLPMLVVFNTLPKIAIAPLFIIYLGYGVLPNAVIAAAVAFFPVVITTATGLEQIDPDLVDLARSLGASKRKVFAKIRLPNALPYIFSGLKVSSTLAVVGAIIGEFVASQSGLGYIEIATETTLNTALAFASLVWMSAIGLALYGLIEALARAVAPWSHVSTETSI